MINLQSYPITDISNLMGLPDRMVPGVGVGVCVCVNQSLDLMQFSLRVNILCTTQSLGWSSISGCRTFWPSGSNEAPPTLCFLLCGSGCKTQKFAFYLEATFRHSLAGLLKTSMTRKSPESLHRIHLPSSLTYVFHQGELVISSVQSTLHCHCVL